MINVLVAKFAEGRGGGVGGGDLKSLSAAENWKEEVQLLNLSELRLNSRRRKREKE